MVSTGLGTTLEHANIFTKMLTRSSLADADCLGAEEC